MLFSSLKYRSFCPKMFRFAPPQTLYKAIKEEEESRVLSLEEEKTPEPFSAFLTSEEEAKLYENDPKNFAVIAFFN